MQSGSRSRRPAKRRGARRSTSRSSPARISGVAALRGRNCRGWDRARGVADGRPEPARGGAGPCPAAGRGDLGDRRAGFRAGAARSSRPYREGHGRAAMRHPEARRDCGRLCVGRTARCASEDHRTDREFARPNHALDPRGDHDRRRDGARRRSRADRPPDRPRAEALARGARHAFAPAAGSRLARSAGDSPTWRSADPKRPRTRLRVSRIAALSSKAWALMPRDTSISMRRCGRSRREA